MPLFSPVSAGGIGKATVTATTGSPSVDTTTRAGKTIYRFTASGSITVGSPGTAEILVVGGGGAGGGADAPAGGGGAGGMVYNASALLPSGTLTVTVDFPAVAGLAINSPPSPFTIDPLSIVAVIASAPFVPPDILMGLSRPK